MVSYLFQVLFERAEMLRKEIDPKVGERHASIIHSIARSISILREDYGLYDRIATPTAEPDAQPQPEQPQGPQVEPAEWDQERPTEEPTHEDIT